MSAAQDTRDLIRELADAGLDVSFDDANTLRRAQITLHHWAEAECGNSDDYKSWAIERNEETGIPYMRVYPHDGKPQEWRIPDREAGALRRVAEVCERIGAHYYHQGDPRGRALYVSREPLTDSAYNRGVAV